MKRTLLVFLLINLMLFACAPASTPAPTPAPSATPLPTATTAPTNTAVPTATPTPIPSIQVGDLSVPDPRVTNPELFDLTKPEAPIPQFVNAMRMAGIEVNGEQILDALNNPKSYKRMNDGKIQILFTTEKDGNKYSMGFVYDPGIKQWREINLNDLNIRIGLELTGKDDPSSNLYNVLSENSSILFTGGKMLYRTSGDAANIQGLHLLEIGNKQLELYMHCAFYPNDTYPNLTDNSATEEFIDDRLKAFLYVAKEAKEKGYPAPTINLLNEGNSFSGVDTNTPIGRFYNIEQFSGVYVRAYRMAQEMGLVVGKDVRFSFSDAYVFGNIKEDIVVQTLNRTMDKISNALNIPRGQIQLDFAGQLRIDYGATQYRQRRAPTPEEFMRAVYKIKEVIGPNNRLYVTEIRVANARNPEDIVNTLAPLIMAGISSGQIDAWMFEAPFRTREKIDPSYNSRNIHLFEEGLAPGIFYYWLLSFLCPDLQ